MADDFGLDLGGNCNLGVGCNETGICYAAAHGQPDQCGKVTASYLARHRTICSVLADIKQLAYGRLDEQTMKLCDEAIDYAQRMSNRLMEYKRKEQP